MRPHVVVGPASQVVVVLRVVPAPVTPTVQASHAQRLGVMTGSPKARQRTSHGWDLQSLREETAKPPLGGALSPHSCVNRWYSKTFLLNSC